MTQYMMMIYAPVDQASADEQGTDISRWIEFDSMLRAAGVHVADHRLHDAYTATTVRVRGGETIVTDGPFADTKEYLAGYYLLETPTLDRVLDLATEVPLVHYGSVEIRPVMAVALPPAEV
jgi:hypothetical protein